MAEEEEEEEEDVPDQSPRFFVAVHVGARVPPNEKALRSAMKRACLAAASVLRKDDPSTNAGRGSNLTEEVMWNVMSVSWMVILGHLGLLERCQVFGMVSKLLLCWPRNKCWLQHCWVEYLPNFLVGKGARMWAKSKGIPWPTGILEADEWLVTERVKWLVTKRVKRHWEKYKSMLDDAKAMKTEIVGELSSSTQEDAVVSESQAGPGCACVKVLRSIMQDSSQHLPGTSPKLKAIEIAAAYTSLSFGIGYFGSLWSSPRVIILRTTKQENKSGIDQFAARIGVSESKG
ncbi:unnamed protein product [Camellia sinensis]